MKASQKLSFLGCSSEPVSSELLVSTDSLSMDIRFFLISSILTQTWSVMVCSVLSLNWSHKCGAPIRVSHSSRTRQGNGSDRMHHFSQRCKWCSRYSGSQISYTLACPWTLRHSLTDFVAYLNSSINILNLKCSLFPCVPPVGTSSVFRHLCYQWYLYGPEILSVDSESPFAGKDALFWL